MTSEAVRIPHLYIDTNIIADLFYDRNPASVQLLELARLGRWQVSTSQFAVMELIDISQDQTWFIREVNERRRTVAAALRGRYRRRLPKSTLDTIKKDIERFLEHRYPFIQYFYLTPEGFNVASGLCADTNMAAPDCIHVATAMEAGCDVLVTSDEQVLHEAKDYIQVTRPEQARATLEWLGFHSPGI